MKINYQRFDKDGNIESSITFISEVKPISWELDPRTATGYFLRYLAQESGITFGRYDTDEHVRNSLIGENN